MFSNLATKLTLKKMGLPSDPLSSINDLISSPSTSAGSEPAKKPKKLTKYNGPPGSVPGFDGSGKSATAAAVWPAWMSVKSLPLTVQPWLTPAPPPVPVTAEPPRVGEMAPMDRNRELTFGGGRLVLVVFLRCVGCAFAQKTFLALRRLAAKHSRTTLTCVAVSHSSAAATKKWLDLVGGGGAGNVQIVVDEDRAIYAAWGLGLGSVWYVLSPASQVAAFREKGWLGSTVAGSLVRTGVWRGTDSSTAGEGKKQELGKRAGRGAGVKERNGNMMLSMGNGAEVIGREEKEELVDRDNAPTTLMGNKWQEAGAWAVDGRGRIIWGGKAARADDVMDLEAGVRALGLA